MKYAYHPMQMHLHAGHQPGASIESHMYNAKTLGMQYIRITSHDSRTGPIAKPCNSFDFSRGALVYEDIPRGSCGWEEQFGEPSVVFEDGCMVLSASSDGVVYTASGYGFKSSGKRHTVSLLSDLTLTFGFSFEAIGDARFVLDVRMSQRAPDHRPAHLRYVLGEITSADTPHTAEIPLIPSEDGLYRLHLTEDVQRADVREIVGGLDNAMDSVAVLIETKNGGRGVCRLSRFTIDTVYGFDDVVVRQREIAEEVGRRMGVKPFVTTEISAAGQHKNCYATWVPVINYAEHGYSVTQAEAIAHVQKYGGIFSYNHPFEHYKRSELSDEEKNFIVMRDAAAFIASKVWGATLMEVGFVGGRSGFGLKEHLRLWDLIGMGGVFITGYGDSDSHHSDRGWFSGQNFASWIAAPADAEFPVAETDFIDSMKTGRVYMGDPVFLKNPLDLTCEGKPMGSVLTVKDRDTAKRTLEFTSEQPDPDWTVRLIVNGECMQKFRAGDMLNGAGDLHITFDVRPTLPVNVVRAEMYNADGRCIMLTNPIYFVRTAEYADMIPDERLYDD